MRHLSNWLCLEEAVESLEPQKSLTSLESPGIFEWCSGTTPPRFNIDIQKWVNEGHLFKPSFLGLLNFQGCYCLTCDERKDSTKCCPFSCGSWHFDLEDSTWKASVSSKPTGFASYCYWFQQIHDWTFCFSCWKSNMLMIMNFILGSSSLVFNLTTNNYSKKQHLLFTLLLMIFCSWFWNPAPTTWDVSTFKNPCK